MDRRRFLTAAGALTATMVAPPASACLWDSDTLTAEAAGLPELVDVLVGRFARNPPLYYELRLTRFSGWLQQHPDDLPAFDNAAVACDRLGRDDEAIAWMARKKSALDRLPDDATTRENRYRYLANLGTFLAHRWLLTGAPADKTDLRAARDRIKEAITLNPSAHFGRERYQLLAIEAMLDGIGDETKEALASLPSTFLERPDWDDKKRLELRSPHNYQDTSRVWPGFLELGYGDAIQGLSGLIVLGNAWESVDVFHALKLVLQHHGHTSLAYLAHKRTAELLSLGRSSRLVHGPARNLPYTEGFVALNPDKQRELDEYYRLARDKAEQWQQQRTAFMMKRLQRGEHPDSFPPFWYGFEAEPAPRIPGSSWRDRAKPLAWPLGVGTVALGLCALAIRHYKNQRKQGPGAAQVLSGSSGHTAPRRAPRLARRARSLRPHPRRARRGPEATPGAESDIGRGGAQDDAIGLDRVDAEDLPRAEQRAVGRVDDADDLPGVDADGHLLAGRDLGSVALGAAGVDQAHPDLALAVLVGDRDREGKIRGLLGAGGVAHALDLRAIDEGDILRGGVGVDVLVDDAAQRGLVRFDVGAAAEQPGGQQQRSAAEQAKGRIAHGLGSAFFVLVLVLGRTEPRIKKLVAS